MFLDNELFLGTVNISKWHTNPTVRHVLTVESPLRGSSLLIAMMSSSTWCRVFCNLAVLVSLFSTANTAAPQHPTAVSVPVRSNWYGLDGLWSPVSVRVGMSPQWVDLFVSTAGQETLVVGSAGCDPSDTKCPPARGGLFYSNKSSTWVDQGTFGLGLDPQLGFDGDGLYGLDSIALDDKLSVPSQIVAVLNTTDYFLGFFGLGVQPTNITSTDQPTFLASMVENKSLIPSHSYGYTAGAHYRKS